MGDFVTQAAFEGQYASKMYLKVRIFSAFLPPSENCKLCRNRKKCIAGEASLLEKNSEKMGLNAKEYDILLYDLSKYFSARRNE